MTFHLTREGEALVGELRTTRNYNSRSVHHLLDASAPASASCACRRTSASRWEGDLQVPDGVLVLLFKFNYADINAARFW
jgi:hypothetical protein